MNTMVQSSMSEEFANLIRERECSHLRVIERLLEKQDMFEMLSVLSLEWSEDESAEVGRRWARVYLSDYTFDLDIAPSKVDTSRLLAKFMQSLHLGVGSDWKRDRDPTFTSDGRMGYRYRSKSSGFGFNLNVYVGNAGKCEVYEVEEFEEVDDIETRMVEDGKGGFKEVSGVVNTVKRSDCGGFFMTPEEMKEAEANLISA